MINGHDTRYLTVRFGNVLARPDRWCRPSSASSPAAGRYLSEGKFIGSLASLLNGRGAPAAPAGGLHPPYALVLGYMTPLATGAPR